MRYSPKEKEAQKDLFFIQPLLIKRTTKPLRPQCPEASVVEVDRIDNHLISASQCQSFDRHVPVIQGSNK